MRRNGKSGESPALARNRKRGRKPRDATVRQGADGKVRRVERSLSRETSLRQRVVGFEAKPKRGRVPFPKTDGAFRPFPPRSLLFNPMKKEVFLCVVRR